jgi:hypothetical protein
MYSAYAKWVAPVLSLDRSPSSSPRPSPSLSPTASCSERCVGFSLVFKTTKDFNKELTSQATIFIAYSLPASIYSTCLVGDLTRSQSFQLIMLVTWCLWCRSPISGTRILFTSARGETVGGCANYCFRARIQGVVIYFARISREYRRTTTV